MKILQANKFFFLKGGAERYFFELSELLTSKGHEVIPFAMEHDANLPSPYDRYFVRRVELDGSGPLYQRLRAAARVVYSVEASRKLGALLESTRPDVAHLHNIAHQLSPSIIGALKRAGVPVVQTLHDYKLACPAYLMMSGGKVCDACVTGSLCNVVLKRCVRGSTLASFVSLVEAAVHRAARTFSAVDAFLCPSRFLMGVMRRAGVPEEKLFHVPLFLASGTYAPSGAGSDYFVYVGRLSEEKGLDRLIEAKRRVSGMRLVVAGDGDLLAGLRELASGDPGVSFTGFLPGQELAELWRNAAFTVVPSVCYENFPYAVLESFAFGKPVVASRIGGIPEVVRDGENGLLAEPGDPGSLAEKINWLASNPSEVARMGRVARRDVEEVYSAEKHYASVMGHYERILR
ncbi:MAG: glycosyltransferase family 4 protein [Candidatus Eisenbacteria bacterium]|nr:glycosyltransferase family 4 protein [Candidatus Eisenbacteria bacterium]